MKLFLLFTLLFLTIDLTIQSQNENTESNINFSIGVGMNYGGIGTKTIIGKNGSGLLFGLGIYPGGLLGYDVGLQYKDRLVFINASYGASGIIGNGDSKELINSIGIIGGANFNLGKSKKTFLEIGIGRSFTPKEYYSFGYRINVDGLIGIIGIGRNIISKN